MKGLKSPEELLATYENNPNVNTHFPCRGESFATQHVKDRKVNVWWSLRMIRMTQSRGVCAWISCPAFAGCNLKGWGYQHSDNDEAGEIFAEFMGEGGIPSSCYTPKEMEFLNGLLENLEAVEDFIPTDRQMRWLRDLHERFLKRRRDGRL